MAGSGVATREPRARCGPPARRVAAWLALALVVVLAGCGRQPRFVPPEADSTRAALADTLAEQVRVLRERWGAEGAGEEAARLTAAVLLADLRARYAAEPGFAWEDRARALLDSLDVGAELASAPCVLVVNLFARADPTSGSWPWIFWRGESAIQAQAVEGQGLALAAAASRGLPCEGGVATGPAGVAALFTRRGGGGQQPLLLTWRPAGSGLEVAQTLGSDSLGGVGSGVFEIPGGGGVALTTRTWRTPPRFAECATCPHVVHLRRFAWGAAGFQRVADQVVETPYVAFVELIQALAAGDHDGALRRVTEPGVLEAAQNAGWASVRAPWRAAPGSEERRGELVFYRGPSEAWRVRFERLGEAWRVASLEPTTRVIE